jgi:hypothetical protein
LVVQVVTVVFEAFLVQEELEALVLEVQAELVLLVELEEPVERVIQVVLSVQILRQDLFIQVTHQQL